MGKRGITPLHRGGRVGDDGDEVIGVDCGDDDGSGGVPAPPEERGREPPSFFLFFLDLLPRWEKGFPSGPWPPWHGRAKSPSEIGFVSLSLSVSAFLILPFHRFLNSRRSVTPIRNNPLTRVYDSVTQATHYKRIMNMLQHPTTGIPHACATWRAP